MGKGREITTRKKFYLTQIPKADVCCDLSSWKRRLLNDFVFQLWRSQISTWACLSTLKKYFT
jgi:hypothetical protein